MAGFLPGLSLPCPASPGGPWAEYQGKFHLWSARVPSHRRRPSHLQPRVENKGSSTPSANPAAGVKKGLSVRFWTPMFEPRPNLATEMKVSAA